MTTLTETPSIPTRETTSVVRHMRSRRLHGIHNRHAPSCRIRGFGI